MSEFRKGQLVAVWGGSLANRRIRIFCGYSRSTVDGITYYLCREATEPEKDAVAWPHCAPLEEIEPSAFLSCDRNLVDSLQKDRERQHLQIQWLCKVLKNDARTEENNPLCPLNVLWDCEHTPCDVCWEQASLKAVKEAGDVR